MRKIFVVVVILLMGIFCGCSVQEYKRDVSVDTANVIQATDKKMDEYGYIPLETNISQRTKWPDRFVVEYWYCLNGKQQHYGFLVEVTNENIVILEEGSDVDKEYLVNKNPTE